MLPAENSGTTFTCVIVIKVHEHCVLQFRHPSFQGIRNCADMLKEYFEQFGAVDEVQVMFDHTTGRSRGFGCASPPRVQPVQ